MGGQIVDATVIEAHRPRLTRAEKDTIRGGDTPGPWTKARTAQIDPLGPVGRGVSLAAPLDGPGPSRHRPRIWLRQTARCSTARTRRLPSGRIVPTDPRRTWSCWRGGACAPSSSTRSRAARRCRPTSPEAMPRGPASAHTSSTSSLPRSTLSASSFAPSASSAGKDRSRQSHL